MQVLSLLRGLNLPINYQLIVLTKRFLVHLFCKYRTLKTHFKKIFKPILGQAMIVVLINGGGERKECVLVRMYV